MAPRASQKQVAIKTIIDSLGSDADFVEMFIGEAKLVADLVHENIIQVYQLDRTDNTLYIVMEYIDGIDLSAFMARHADVGREVPVDLAAFIVSRVCRGLDYAHKKRDGQGGLLGVVHRDVTPRNIMITGQGVVKLGDFGVAKAHKLLASREGAVLMGKAPYMSPEQADYKDTDGRSDLFSLGTVFYRLLTGVSVFKSDEVGSTLRNGHPRRGSARHVNQPGRPGGARSHSDEGAGKESGGPIPVGGRDGLRPSSTSCITTGSAPRTSRSRPTSTSSSPNSP